ncbi:hypothetical protein KKF84_13805 [Myxococcota bacterium]|nr:hypothetical protein [Myxococcota bacterium]
MLRVRCIFCLLALLAAASCDDDPKETYRQEICSNLMDDNGDGLVDCEDPQCATLPECQPAEVLCGNNLDDDGDGLVDCEDPDCDEAADCVISGEICENGIDDDKDGSIDCDDEDCMESQYCLLLSCSRLTLFPESQNFCDTGEKCMIDETFAATCVVIPATELEFYDPCTTTPECPRGSLCRSDGDNPASCLPLCRYDDPLYRECPGSGTCSVALQGTDLHLCIL